MYARFLALTLSIGCAGTAAAAAPFHAPAVPQGGITVQLCPAPGLTGSAPRLVTFGLPLPRGSLTAAQLNTVRVLRDGVEQPAFVDPLTPWRHRRIAALDGSSVRVARIQLSQTFSGDACRSIEVSWGGAPRTQNLPALTSPRTGWHVVTSGSYIAADAVEEPDVLAVLPRQWLANGAIKGVQHQPFDASVGDARDNPALLDATAHWPAEVELDQAQKNFFFALINEDDPAVSAANRCNYKTDYEPWLYDRAAAMYVLYLRSGSVKSLREAVRAADFYADRINASGYFSLRNGDTKYAYAESLAYTAWLTGDTSLLAKVTAVVTAQDSFGHVWQNDPDRFWTERHAAFKLLANAIAYELNGGSAQATKVDGLIAELVRHQNGAGGAIPQPPGFVDGGFYHYGSQHDSDWDDASLGASSWMSMLLADAVLRAYASAEDDASAALLRRLGNFLAAATIDTTAHSYEGFAGALALPRYAILSNGSDGQVNEDDVEHAIDVAAGVAWAAYFADRAGMSAQAQALRQRAQDLYFTYDTAVNEWIQPGGPAAGRQAYRVSPWRKWAWEHRVSAGFGWALRAGTDTLFADGFE